MLCDSTICTGCAACQNICSMNCIKVEPNVDGYLEPLIDKNRCTDCGVCETVCPILAPFSYKRYSIPLTYACWNLDEVIRSMSASGGMFSVFAEHFLEQNGSVVGASYDEKMYLKHIIITSRDDLVKLRGSKYLQSDINFVFRDVKTLLNEQKSVFFTGTPCQIAGLYAFLDKDSNNPLLMTADLICQGVGAHIVFEKYIEYLEQKYHSTVIDVNFRYKGEGGSANTLIKFNNGSVKVVKGDDNAFRRGYGSKLFYRESCYGCRFATIPRLGDISLGDFWGIESKITIAHDVGNSISLVFVNSQKGEDVFNACRGRMFCEKRNFKESEEGNPNIRHSALYPPNRDKFIEDFKSISFNKLIHKHLDEEQTLSEILGKIIRKYLGIRFYQKLRLFIGL